MCTFNGVLWMMSVVDDSGVVSGDKVKGRLEAGALAPVVESRVAVKTAMFVLSQKGGVGKTTFSRAWLDVARGRGRRVAALDADGKVGQLLRFYGTREASDPSKRSKVQDPLMGVGYFDVRDAKQRDEIVNLVETEADWMIVDMPGGSMHEMDNVVGDGKSLIGAYVDNGWRVVIVVVIDHLMTPTRTVLESMKMFGDRASYVVVKNLAVANPDEFIVFDGYMTKAGESKYGNARRQLEERGGEVVEMPRLEPRTYALIDVESLSFADAAANTERKLEIADSMRAKRFLEKFEACLSESKVIDP